MGEVVEAQADVKLGEAFKPAAEAQSRVYRGEIAGTLALALPFVGGIVAGSLAGGFVSVWYPQWGSWPTSILSVAGMTIGLVFGLRAYSKRHMSGFLAELRKMGSPPLFPTHFRFADDAIHIDSGRVAHRIAWEAVLFVLPGRDHWLLQADTLTLAIPRRAFADPGAEQAFLDLVQGHISEAARSRSVFKSH
ncbi:MAG TPA: YcxB family protein [Sphingomicrobium sp.]|jgi:hypothetical protein|nr:YcxB family protein [Sphingomicrobium sp.]